MRSGLGGGVRWTCSGFMLCVTQLFIRRWSARRGELGCVLTPQTGPPQGRAKSTQGKTLQPVISPARLFFFWGGGSDFPKFCSHRQPLPGLLGAQRWRLQWEAKKKKNPLFHEKRERRALVSGVLPRGPIPSAKMTPGGGSHPPGPSLAQGWVPPPRTPGPRPRDAAGDAGG